MTIHKILGYDYKERPMPAVGQSDNWQICSLRGTILSFAPGIGTPFHNAGKSVVPIWQMCVNYDEVVTFPDLQMAVDTETYLKRTNPMPINGPITTVSHAGLSLGLKLSSLNNNPLKIVEEKLNAYANIVAAIKCECGATKVYGAKAGSTLHSSWCPVK